jgi:hypothetical protein
MSTYPFFQDAYFSYRDKIFPVKWVISVHIALPRFPPCSSQNLLRFFLLFTNSFIEFFTWLPAFALECYSRHSPYIYFNLFLTDEL